MAESLQPVFDALRERMLRAGDGLTAEEAPGNLVLKTEWLDAKKQPAWFGAVQLKKNYVSFHLMPLYALPALKAEMPADLAKKMQGKSCFNFKTVDSDLFDALEQLTRICAAAYAAPVEARPH